MAREFAQIKLSIWADDDWRDLSPDARYLYMTLLTSPTLTHCGTADWRPARLSAVNGQDRDTIEDAGSELVESLHLVIDHETEEVLIRSFIRNDGLMKQPKMAVAMASAHAGVASTVLRGVVVHEAKRLKEDHPALNGWGSEKAIELLGLRSVDPTEYPLGKGSIKGKATPIRKGSLEGCPTTTPTPATTSSRLTPALVPTATPANAVAVRVNDRFEEFWNAYGRKVGRGKAVPAFKKAAKKADPLLIIKAAHEHADFHDRQRTEARFIPHPATWLNEERWLDERSARDELGPRSRRQDETDGMFDAAMQRAVERDQADMEARA